MSLSYLTGTQPQPGKVTPVISGAEYIRQLDALFRDLQAGDKVYLHNWHIAPTFFYIEEIAGNKRLVFLLNRLHELVNDGVDVRLMLWVNSNLFEPFYPLSHHPDMQPDSGEEDSIENWAERWRGTLSYLNRMPHPLSSFQSTMNANLYTVDLWRRNRFLVNQANMPADPAEDLEATLAAILSIQNDATLAERIVINTLDSAAGGCHMKFALVLKQDGQGGYEGTAFTGGIDFAINRLSSPPYKNHTSPEGEKSLNYWHDIMARVEGRDIIRPLFDYYRTLWNDNLSRRDTYNPFITAYLDNEVLDVESIPPGAEVIEDLSGNVSTPLGNHWAQSVFTVPDIWQLFGTSDNPIIGEPENPTYPEGHFSLRQSVFHLIDQAQQYLYVEDQGMQSLELWKRVCQVLKSNDELRVILLTGSDPADAANDISRKLVRWLYYDELDIGQRERLFFINANYTIHSKLFLADDAAAIIGSGGFFTRSLNEELEHSIAYVDEAGDSIRSFRQALWKVHTGIDFPNQYPDLADALNAWADTPFPLPGVNEPPDQARLEAVDLSEDKYVLLGPDDVAWSEVPQIIDLWLHGETLSEEDAGKLETFGEFFNQQWQVAFHLLLTEVPFLSIFNPSQTPAPFAIPEIGQQRLAVHQRTTLALHCQPGQTITWQVHAADGTLATATPSNECQVHFSAPGIKLVEARYSPAGSQKELVIPFVLNILENSGLQWVERFPGSRDPTKLQPQFLSKLTAFITALHQSGLLNGLAAEDVYISSYRPPERAFLMGVACDIARNGISPDKIKDTMPGVDISWLHYQADGTPNLEASIEAAVAMVGENGYNIGSTGAAKKSRHTEGLAIDMKIPVNGTYTVVDGNGNSVEVSTQADLTRVGRSFGVYRLRQSNHWSSDGH